MGAAVNASFSLTPSFAFADLRGFIMTTMSTVTNPWDRPPVPPQGDNDQDRTYCGVGRVVSEWETIELELAHLYSLFENKFGNPVTVQDYGADALFADRVSKLVKAKERFFARNSNQSLDAEFCELLERIRKYADRRHDVAHGIVRPIIWAFGSAQAASAASDLPFHYCVVAPDYKENRFDEHHLPIYAYTWPEMMQIQGALHGAAHEVMRYKRKLVDLIEAGKLRP
jgi:hypothetical protein